MNYIPEIYNSDNTDYSDPLGNLPDIISCKVTEERNGEYYCEMQYPSEGTNASLLQVGRIFATYVQPGGSGGKQPFRIATIEKHLDGTMDITAYHISYDLGNVVVMPFTATGISDAVDGLVSNSVPATDFSIYGYITSSKQFTVTQPTPLKSLLIGVEGSLVDTYGGELEYSGWNVYLRSSRGTQKNAQIAYGKNLSSFTETDEDGPYDAVVPYAVVDDVVYYLTDTGVCATAPVVPSSRTYGYPRTITVDFSDKFDSDSTPTQAQLLAVAQSYINGHSTAPTANYSTAFLDLSKIMAETDQIELCDTIYLTIGQYGVFNMKLKVIKTVYDVLLDEYESVQIGDKKLTLADTLANLTR